MFINIGEINGQIGEIEFSCRVFVIVVIYCFIVIKRSEYNCIKGLVNQVIIFELSLICLSLKGKFVNYKILS